MLEAMLCERKRQKGMRAGEQADQDRDWAISLKLPSDTWMERSSFVMN